MKLEDFEVFEKREPIKYYALRFEGIVKTFSKWKEMTTTVFGPGVIFAYRLWQKEEDPEVAKKCKEIGDFACMEVLPDDFQPIEKDESSIFMFAPNNRPERDYLSQIDCRDWIVYEVSENGLKDIIHLTEDQFEERFEK